MPRILLVDDSRTMRNIEKNVIAGILGVCDIVEAADGVEALKQIAASTAPFDLILADWNMPNMDGLTMVTKVREVNKTTPIMMVTTEAEKSRIIDAVKAGANNYCIKPFTPQVLGEKIKQTLEKAKATAAAA